MALFYDVWRSVALFYDVRSVVGGIILRCLECRWHYFTMFGVSVALFYDVCRWHYFTMFGMSVALFYRNILFHLAYARSVDTYIVVL